MATEDPTHNDRRSETRRTETGDTTLWLNGSPLTVPGHLINVTKSGFRVRHNAPTLRPGHIVDFEPAVGERPRQGGLDPDLGGEGGVTRRDRTQA